MRNIEAVLQKKEKKKDEAILLVVKCLIEFHIRFEMKRPPNYFNTHIVSTSINLKHGKLNKFSN